jgi:hypothetical protein
MTQETTITMRGDYVLLRADRLRLLVPQRTVLGTDYRDQTPRPTDLPGVHALADVAGVTRRVVALSEDMQPLENFPADRFLLTRLSADPDCAMAWNEVRVLIDTELSFHDLPDVLKGVTQRVDAYVELDGELAFCTTPDRIYPQLALDHEHVDLPD